MKTFTEGLLAATLIVASIPAIACTPDAKRGFVPKNNLKIYTNAAIQSGITEKEFNDVITKVETMYSPIVANYGGNLVVERNWTDGTVNAYAQQNGKTWKVSMFGGLARHEAITVDGMALVVCHELGHHIGGAPRKASQWASSWASNEGQADYFANLKCLRRVWASEKNQQIVARMKSSVPESLTKACKQANPDKDDNAICVRGGMAGMSVAKLFQALERGSAEPKFETPDTKQVAKTNDNHPAYQCRLDTYFQGSLCEKPFTEDVSADSEVTGTCHGSTNQRVGLRPRCWFKPSVK
jgi:predicted Zn-dependent protease with MMP-like domain